MRVGDTIQHVRETSVILTDEEVQILEAVLDRDRSNDSFLLWEAFRALRSKLNLPKLSMPAGGA